MRLRWAVGVYFLLSLVAVVAAKSRVYCKNGVSSVIKLKRGCRRRLTSLLQARVCDTGFRAKYSEG